MAKRRVYPFPEAIQPGEWVIKEGPADGNGAVHLAKKQMWVPTANSAKAAAVRAHELAHIAFSPVMTDELRAKFSDVSETTIQAVENYRVNLLANRKNVNFDAGMYVKLFEAGLEQAEVMNTPQAFAAYAMGVFTGEERQKVLEKGRQLFPEADIDDVVGQARYMFDSIYEDAEINFDLSIQVARFIVERLPDTEEQAKLLPGMSGRSDGETRVVFNIAENLSNGWGRCVLELPRLFAPKHQRGPRSSDEGANLRAPWRLPVDQKVFREVLRAPRRGAVLVDASSSMSFEMKDIQDLVKTIPAGIIAAYDGSPVTNIGHLRVLAKHGRIAEPEQFRFFDGGNVVDGPALQWLGQQQGPRIWVCDGYVTGRGDGSTTQLVKEAFALVEKYSIKRVLTMKEALYEMSKRR